MLGYGRYEKKVMIRNLLGIGYENPDLQDLDHFSQPSFSLNAFIVMSLI